MVKTCPFDSLADLQWHHIIIVISQPYLVIPKFIGHLALFKAQRKSKQKRTRQKTEITSFFTSSLLSHALLSRKMHFCTNITNIPKKRLPLQQSQQKYKFSSEFACFGGMEKRKIETNSLDKKNRIFKYFFSFFITVSTA